MDLNVSADEIRFRDDVRAFWLTGEVGIGTLAQRIAGSSEIFGHHGRGPTAGINFITAHDGFTLRDLVSYRHKHNELNGESNRDGHGHNLSSNCGVEGETLDAQIQDCRRQLQYALLATLFFGQGVPMLQGGDELGRTQFGNNNAYCQDNPLTWLDWSGSDGRLIDFTAGVIRLRQRFAQLRRACWLNGTANATGERDVIWWHREGREMHDHDWHTSPNTLGMLLAPPETRDSHSGESTAARVMILFNRRADSVTFNLPPGEWKLLCDSRSDKPFDEHRVDHRCSLAGRSVLLLAQG